MRRSNLVFTILLISIAAVSRVSAADRDAAISAAIARGAGWLESAQIDPFSQGAASIRMYTMEIEARHRLWYLEKDPVRRGELDTRVTERLRAVLDAGKLNAALSGEGGSGAFTEIAILADRCRQHGVDPAPLSAALAGRRDALRAEVERVPPSVRLLYAAYLPAVGVDLGLSFADLRSKGMLAIRPRGVDLTLTDVYYLTHEIFAYSDYATRPLSGLTEEERLYLLETLPFFTVFYAAWNNLDVVGELLACLWAAGMRDTWAYEEGIRVLLERQNADGSFGGPDPRTLDRPVMTEEVLHPTMNCLTVLLLDATGE
jgi:hypothetical protein